MHVGTLVTSCGTAPGIEGKENNSNLPLLSAAIFSQITIKFCCFKASQKVKNYVNTDAYYTYRIHAGRHVVKDTWKFKVCVLLGQAIQVTINLRKSDDQSKPIIGISAVSKPKSQSNLPDK